jgi:hypothetical protein
MYARREKGEWSVYELKSIFDDELAAKSLVFT